MGIVNPKEFKDVIGKKIIFEGKEVIIDSFKSGYEGEYFLLYIPDFGYTDYNFFSPEGREIRAEIDRLRKEMKNKK